VAFVVGSDAGADWASAPDDDDQQGLAEEEQAGDYREENHTERMAWPDVGGRGRVDRDHDRDRLVGRAWALRRSGDDSPGGERVASRFRIGRQAAGEDDPAGCPGRQGAGAGDGGAVTAPGGYAAGGVHGGVVQTVQQAELHAHLVGRLGRRRIRDGHGGVKGAADRAGPGSGRHGNGAVADAPVGPGRTSAANHRDSGRHRSAEPGAGAEAGQVAGGAVVPPDLADVSPALVDEVDVQGAAVVAGAGLQAVADSVPQDAVRGQRPLLGLDGVVARLQQDRETVAGGLPAQVRVPDRIDLDGPGGGAAACGRGGSRGENHPDGQDHDRPQPVNAAHRQGPPERPVTHSD
jgi:hypothetical protein